MAETGLRHRLSPTPSQKRRVFAEWPMLTVMAGTGFGMVLMGGGRIVFGAGVMGLSMFGAAALRLLLPTKLAGTLAIRRRVVDVGVYGTAGFMLILLGLMVHGLFSSSA